MSQTQLAFEKNSLILSLTITNMLIERKGSVPSKIFFKLSLSYFFGRRLVLFCSHFDGALHT